MGNLKKIKRQIAQEADEFYGEETVSGSMPSPQSDDSTTEMVKKSTGNAPQKKKSYNIALEINKEEKKIRRSR